MNRSKPIRRRTRLRPRNPERRAKLDALQFGPYAAYIRALPCCACDRRAGADPHHVRSRGCIGRWYDCVPLCRLCHREFHDHGPKTFQEKYGLDFGRLIEGYLRRFLIEKTVGVRLRERLRELDKEEQFDPIMALLIAFTLARGADMEDHIQEGEGYER